MSLIAKPEPAERPVLSAEDRAALVDTLRRLLAARSGEAAVRAAMDSERGYDEGLWRDFAAMGLVGAIVDPADGGAGLGAVELELLTEEMGAALVCSPMLSSGVLAAGLLQRLGRREHLPAIADGSLVATVAVVGPRGGWTEADVEVSAVGGRLSGRSGFVTDAQVADLLLVVAREADGVGVYEVRAGSAGLTVSPLPTFDRTRRMAEVAFDAVEARRIGSGWAPVEAALNLARIALAGEAAGGARAMLARTVDYIKQRHQFGRPVGGFQAIKHMAADLLLESESALSAARHAAEQWDAGAPDAERAVTLASFACPDAFERVCADAIQMHGGIAFTWEHPAHLYLRRARADAQLFGSSAFYRERYVQELGG